MIQDEHDVQQAINLLTRSWNTHDPGRFAASFSQDAQFTDVVGHTAQGHDEIARLHVIPFARLFTAAVLEVEQAPIRFVADDVASVNLHWTMQGHTSGQGEPLPPRQGIMHLVMVKREGQWWPVVAHNTDYTATYTQS